MKNKVVAFSVIFYLLALLHVNTTGHADSPWDQDGVNSDKNWTILFNTEMDGTTVHKENIYIIDNSGAIIDGINVYLNEDKVSATVEAPDVGYKAGHTYQLIITTNVKSATGIPLRKNVAMTFSIKNEHNGNDEVYYGEFNYNKVTGKVLKYDSLLDESKVLAEEPAYGRFFDVGDWIYYLRPYETIEYGDGGIYSELHRVKKDGTKMDVIVDETVEDFYIQNDWIYYILNDKKAEPGKRGLYKIKVDGTQNQEIIDSTQDGISLSELAVKDDWIYFYGYNNGERGIFKMKTDGSGITKLSRNRFNGLDYNFPVVENDLFIATGIEPCDDISCGGNEFLFVYNTKTNEEYTIEDFTALEGYKVVNKKLLLLAGNYHWDDETGDQTFIGGVYEMNGDGSYRKVKDITLGEVEFVGLTKDSILYRQLSWDNGFHRGPIQKIAY